MTFQRKTSTPYIPVNLPVYRCTILPIYRYTDNRYYREIPDIPVYRYTGNLTYILKYSLCHIRRTNFLLTTIHTVNFKYKFVSVPMSINFFCLFFFPIEVLLLTTIHTVHFFHTSLYLYLCQFIFWFVLFPINKTSLTTYIP